MQLQYIILSLQRKRQMTRDMNNFMERIDRLNRVFKTGFNERPTDLGPARVRAFYSVLSDEVDELLMAKKTNAPVDLVAYADCLADIIVYCTSEARRWGIPIVPVLHVVMDSQDSKLDSQGAPIYNEEGTKFIKGPDYQPPEENIRNILFPNESI